MESTGVHTLATLSGRNGHFQEEIVIPRKQASLISYQQPYTFASPPFSARAATPDRSMI
jgi:hypothetical protein